MFSLMIKYVKGYCIPRINVLQQWPYLISLYKDKDIVHTNSQHKEWYNFYDNQGHWYIHVTIETNIPDKSVQG